MIFYPKLQTGVPENVTFFSEQAHWQLDADYGSAGSLLEI